MKRIEKKSMAAFAAIVLSVCVQCSVAGTQVPGLGDVSARGPLTVATLEFADLVDAGRTGGEPPVQRPRLFSRLRRQVVSPENPGLAQGRRIPIKVHMPTTGGPYPVVVVSHGAGGNWDTHYAQAQHLASYGYVVLCLEHIGSNTDRLKSGIRVKHNIEEMIRDSSEVLGRPKDVSFALDCAMEWNKNHDQLRGRLDLGHVGVMGHSFGAYTTMVACGMRPALDWLEPPVAPGRGLGPNLRDGRILCGVALSPQGADEPFFLRDSFVSLTVPLLGVSGTEDKQQGGLPPVNRYQAFDLWPAKQGQHKFVWLANAHHLDFTDSEGSGGRALRSSTRDDVQPMAKAATLLFFNAHLKSDAAAAQALTSEGLKPYLRGEVNSVDVRSK